jgi:hypothetical protein
MRKLRIKLRIKSRIKLRKNRAWILALAAFPLLFGCGSDSADSGSTSTAVSISTTVEPASLVAGGDVQVECVAHSGAGDAIVHEGFEVVVGQSEGFKTDGLVLTFSKAGTYDVACASIDPELVDESPAKVGVLPGPPVRSVATLKPQTTPPGGLTIVTCDVTDEFGNQVSEGVTITVDPADGVNQTGEQLSSTTAGNYQVSCIHGETEFETQEPATWTVEVGAPVSFALAFEPEQVAYRTGDDIPVSGVTTDEYGNEAHGLPVEGLTTSPETDVIIKGDNKDIVKFKKEGIYSVSARSVDYPDLEATRTLVVDQTPPTITIRYPARGITTDSMTEVVVEGTVTDNLGKVELVEVVGQKVALNADGGFTATVPLSYGINLLIVRAYDPYGNESEAGRAITYSTHFYPLDNLVSFGSFDLDGDGFVSLQEYGGEESDFTELDSDDDGMLVEAEFAMEITEANLETNGVDSGLVVLMSKEAIDDGDHTLPPDDLATIFEVVFSSMDLGALLPKPLIKSPITQCDYNIRDITFDAPTVTLTPQAGSLGLEVVIENFKANFYNEGNFICFLDTDITIDKLILVTNIKVNLTPEGTTSSAEDTEVTLENFNIEWDFLNVASLFQGIMEDVFALLVEDQVGGALGDVFSAFALNEEFEIPAFIDGMSPNKLTLETIPAAIEFDPDYMMIALDALAHATEPHRPYEVLGSIGYAGCGPDDEPLTPPDSPLVIALHDDVLNQLLFAVWEGGTLSMDLGPEDTKDLEFGGSGLPVDDLSLFLDAQLPLIFNSCEGGVNKIQIGDLYMEASFSMSVLGQADIAFWIQGEATVEFAIVEDETGATKLGFELQDLDPLVLEVARNEGLFEGDDAALRDLIKEQMLPELLGSLTGGLGSFPLPEIDLSGISEDIPEGTAIALGIEEFDRKGGYLVMKGALK